MNARLSDSFGSRDTLVTPAGKFEIHRLAKLESALGVSIAKLPFSIRILLEAALRTCDGFQVGEADVKKIAGWVPEPEAIEIPFKPARVILQDFTGVPCVVDQRGRVVGAQAPDNSPRTAPGSPGRGLLVQL